MNDIIIAGDFNQDILFLEI